MPLRNYDLGATCTYCYRGIILRLSQQTKLGDAHIYVHTDTCVCMYEYVCVHRYTLHIISMFSLPCKLGPMLADFCFDLVGLFAWYYNKYSDSKSSISKELEGICTK